MPHLEDQFPPVNPLVLQRPDALDPPDREEDERDRPVENRAEDEAPIPGSLADGVDRVTLSANARRITPVQPLEDTVAVPRDIVQDNGLNPAAPEILNPGLQGLADGLTANRASNEAAVRVNPNPSESPATPIAPAVPPAPNAERATGETAASRIENRIAAQAPPAANIQPERSTTAAPINENRFVPVAPAPRGPLSVVADDVSVPDPAEAAPEPDTLGLQGNTPAPRTEGRVNILTPATGGEVPPEPINLETLNPDEGRALTLDLETAGNESNFVTLDNVDEVLAETGAIPGPAAPAPQAEEIALPPAAPVEVNATPVTADAAPDPQDNNFVPVVPDPRDFNAQRQPVIPRDPVASEGVNSFLINTNEVLEANRETQALQAPAFPELDPNQPFVPDVPPEAREEAVPAVVQAPVIVPAPAVEDAVPVAPPAPGNVETLNENPQALRRDNLGTDPALRSNRELRNILQAFNNRIEPPEEVTEPAGGPIPEIQNNAPPSPAVLENLEAASAELLNDVREEDAAEGVTRPEEERIAPPEPRTPESLLTGRGQNIDRFI